MASTTSLTTEISAELNEGRPGCALCSLWAREEDSLVAKIRKEGAPAGSEFKGRLVAASGFCNRHSHVLCRGGPNAKEGGVAQCSEVVLRKLEENLTTLLGNVQTGKGRVEPGDGQAREPLTVIIAQLEKTINGESVCPICERLLRSDKERIAGLLPLLESKDMAGLYGKSDGLCMPHYVTAMRALQASPSRNVETVWSLMVKTQIARLSSVDVLLNERMEKYSWDKRDAGITTQEAGAQKTGMLTLVGIEGLYCRPRKTSLRPAKEK